VRAWARPLLRLVAPTPAQLDIWAPTALEAPLAPAPRSLIDAAIAELAARRRIIAPAPAPAPPLPAPAAAAARRDRVASLAFDPSGKLLLAATAGSGRPGRLALFDVAEQLAHSARVRLSLQPNAPEPPLLGAAAQLAPLHALATPGPVEALALRPSRGGDSSSLVVGVVCRGSRDVYLFQMLDLPSAPFRVFRREREAPGDGAAAAAMRLHGNASVGAANTAIIFFEEEVAPLAAPARAPSAAASASASASSSASSSASASLLLPAGVTVYTSGNRVAISD